MIDTITLRLDDNEYNLTDRQQFNIIRKGAGYCDYIHSQTRVKKHSSYFPSVRIRDRFSSGLSKQYLYTEFSAPKLLFGNNIEELRQSDIGSLLEVLEQKLNLMGIEIVNNSLPTAGVVKIHYGKNLLLPQSVFPSMIISKLRGSDYSGIFTGTQRDYKNDGSSMRISNRSREVIIYDKVAEIQSNRNDKLLASYLKNAKLQILRLEVRLKVQSTIARETSIDKDNLTLSKLTLDCLVEKILNKYWDLLLSDISAVNLEGNNLEMLYSELLLQKPQMRLHTINSIMAMQVLKENIGLKRLRAMIESQYSRETWYTYKKLLKKISTLDKTPYWTVEIEKQLKKYEPVRLNDFTNDRDLPYTIS